MSTATEADVGERPMARSLDPRAVRTRRKLIDAFGRLAESTNPAEISVSALTEAAGVHRSAFYKHFASPEDLAIHLLHDLFSVISRADVVMRSEFAVNGFDASRSAMLDIVRFVGARRSTYAPLLGSRAPATAVQRVTDAFAELTVEALEQMPTRPFSVDTQVVSRFLAHGVIGVVGRWLDDARSTLSDEQVVEQLMLCFPGWLTASSETTGHPPL
ncbi:MAG: TetR/AcrR family transcriptional regulator [Gordonia sp.]|nr:TetR/AcrR family transcriptional regulator [Gordonia sp. (in: high G+C Gram-positive bacteria)]